MPRILFSTSPALYFGGARGRGNQGRGRISAWQFVVCVRGELFEGKKKKNDDDDAAFKPAPRSLEKSPKKKIKNWSAERLPLLIIYFPSLNGPRWLGALKKIHYSPPFSVNNGLSLFIPLPSSVPPSAAFPPF